MAEFLEKIKQGGVAASRGFGGRGLEKMEEQREYMKKAQKLVYNQDDLESSDDEELIEVDGELCLVSKKKSELEEKIEQQLNSSFNSKAANEAGTAKTDAGALDVVMTEADETAVAESAEAPVPSVAPSEIALSDLANVAKCKEIIALISIRVQEQAHAMVGSTNLKDSKKASIVTDAEEKPASFNCEIEINDYPQYARWKVTNRDSVNTIYDVSKAAITVRGTFINPNSKAPLDPAVRKLYLFVEAESELALDRAKAEIKRIIKEATFEAVSKGHLDPATRGKYSI